MSKKRELAKIAREIRQIKSSLHRELIRKSSNKGKATYYHGDRYQATVKGLEDYYDILIKEELVGGAFDHVLANLDKDDEGFTDYYSKGWEKLLQRAASKFKLNKAEYELLVWFHDNTASGYL